MTKRKPTGNSKVKRQHTQFLDEFSNYENAVTFISSLEAWFEYRWGENGHVVPRLLAEFDRFPQIDGLTPDFIARFRRPYVLVGEHIKTFRRGEQGRKDVAQIVAYSRWKPSEGDVEIPHDVVVFVDVFADEVAHEQMQHAWEQPDPSCPVAPVVIVGYARDTERANGEWYKCKWRKHLGNHEFSKPNICSDAKVDDLNAIFIGKTPHAIPVDRHTLDLSNRNPLINDAPPALYSLVRVVFPALVALLRDDERDILQSKHRVVKTTTRQEILESDFPGNQRPRPKIVQDALDFLVSPLKLATKDASDPPKYEITIDLKELAKDWKDLFSLRAARALVRKMRVDARGKRGPRAQKGQLKFAFGQEQAPR